METGEKLIEISKRIRALAENGLFYSGENEYDKERYAELYDISNEIASEVSGNDVSDIRSKLFLEENYVTPKVDIRAVVFNDQNEILLVKEKADGLWALPGGWADIGFSPKEVAVKEVQEETGLNVIPVKLLAVMDRKCHNHPPSLLYFYKIFIQCEITGGSFNHTFDILDKGFFAQDNLPPLSLERNLKSQIDLMFEYKNNPGKEAIVD